jgi:hypothetical protein
MINQPIGLLRSSLSHLRQQCSEWHQQQQTKEANHARKIGSEAMNLPNGRRPPTGGVCSQYLCYDAEVNLVLCWNSLFFHLYWTRNVLGFSTVEKVSPMNAMIHSAVAVSQANTDFT